VSKRQIFQTRWLGVSTFALCVALSGCGDRYENPYENADRELASNRPLDGNVNSGPRRLSGLMQVSPDAVELISQLAPTLNLESLQLLVAQSRSSRSLDIMLCGPGVQTLAVQRLEARPGESGTYDLPAELRQNGLSAIKVVNERGELSLDLVHEFAVIDMVPVNTQEMYTLDAPRGVTVEQSRAVCGMFAQPNGLPQSSAFGSFGFVADYGIYLLDLQLPRGLHDDLGTGDVIAALSGSWNSNQMDRYSKDLLSSQIDILRCEDSALTFRLQGEIEEGSWRMSLSHQLRNQVVCPGELPEDPLEEEPLEQETPAEFPGNPVEEDDVVEEVLEEEVLQEEGVDEVPPVEDPIEEEPIEPPLPPVEEVPLEEFPVGEELPPPVAEEPPVLVGDAQCTPTTPPSVETLTGRWQMSNAELFLTILPLPPALSGQLSNSLFLVDHQTNVSLALCEIPEVEIALTRNGDELISEEFNQLLGNLDGIDVAGLKVTGADQLTVNSSFAGGNNIGFPFERQPVGEQSVCWDSNLLDPLPASADICAAVQQQGLRLVFEAQGYLIAVDFALPTQPEVGTYEVTEAYPATLLSDRFVESGLPAQQRVESGSLIIDAIGQSSVAGRFRLDLAGGEEVLVSFTSHLSRVAVDGAPLP
jgi:hypothetical protein